MSGLSRTRQNCFGVRTPILSPQPPAGSTAATVPWRLPGSAPAADNGDSRIAEPAPAGPLTQCPGSAGLLHSPGSIASRAQNPEVQMGTVSETPTPALGRDYGSDWARNDAERTRGRWPRVLIAEGANKPVVPAWAQRPKAALFLLFPLSLRAGRAQAAVAVLTFLTVTQAAMHNTVTGPIPNKWEIFIFKVQMCAPRS